MSGPWASYSRRFESYETEWAVPLGASTEGLACIPVDRLVDESGETIMVLARTIPINKPVGEDREILNESVAAESVLPDRAASRRLSSFDIGSLSEVVYEDVRGEDAEVAVIV